MAQGSTVCTTFNQLRIESLPSGKVVKMDRAIKVDETIVFIGADGKLYCPRVRPGTFYRVSDWGFINPMLNALVKLGVASKEDVDNHKAAAKKEDDRGSARHDMQQLAVIADKYGFELTGSQLSKIKSVSGLTEDHQ